MEASFLKPHTDFFEPRQRLKIKHHFDVGSIKKIVIRGIDPLGDMAIASSFFREVRRFFPNAHILNLASSHALQWMEHCPYVDETRVLSSNLPLRKTLRLAKELKQEQYDLAFLMSGNIHAAIFAFLAGIPNRIGYDSDGRGFLLTVKLHQEFHSRYRGEDNFDFLRALGFQPSGLYKRECWLTNNERAEAIKVYARNGIKPQQTLLGFNPFSKDPLRQWDGENWRAFLQTMKNQGCIPIAFVGPNESKKAKKLVSLWGHNDVIVIEETLLVTSAMLEFVDWVVAVDSGFMHMALAVGKPRVIGIYGLLPAVSSFPIFDSHHKSLLKEELFCAPCYMYRGSDKCFNDSQCMKALTSQDVFKAMHSMGFSGVK